MAGSRQSGIVVTQPGTSAPYAADYQMVYNSNWPSLAIAFEATGTLANGASATIPHKLGFYPLTLVWLVDPSTGTNLGRVSDVAGSFYGPLTVLLYQFDNQNIYIQNNGGYNTNTYNYSVKCYNVDISKAADYTLPQPPILKTAYDPNFGIKVSKYGKSVGSNDLRDFILHSRAQSPAVLSIVTKATTPDPNAPYQGTSLNYVNPANYTPWVLAFIKGPNDTSKKYELLAPGSQQAGYLHRLQGKYSQIANSAGTPYGSLVVLRDPLVVTNTKRIVY